MGKFTECTGLSFSYNFCAWAYGLFQRCPHFSCRKHSFQCALFNYLWNKYLSFTTFQERMTLLIRVQISKV